MVSLRTAPHTLGEMRVFRRRVLAHWQRLAKVEDFYAAADEGIGADSCAFCKMTGGFNPAGPYRVCGVCPVMRLTGRSGCARTPYHAASRYYRLLRNHSPGSSLELSPAGAAVLAKFREAARQELAFLTRVTDEHLKAAIARQKKLLSRRSKND